MMLSETLLDVASFLGYATLVMLRLTNKQLLRFADRYADQLAFRRSFVVSYGSVLQSQLYNLSIAETRVDNQYVVVHTVELDETDDEHLTSSATELQSHIGPHAVDCALLEDLSFSVKLFVDQIPALRFASDIHLDYVAGSSPPSEEYVAMTSLFERPTFISLTEIPIEALVVFLQSTSASGLTGWAAHAPLAEKNNALNATAEDTIFRSCFDFTNNEQGDARQIYFDDWNFRRDFLLRLIEASVDSQRHILIVVSTPSWVPAEHLTLDDGFTLSYWRLTLDPESFEEKSVAIRDFLQRGQHRPNPWIKLAYFSKRSDVVVFVKHDTITITNHSSFIGFPSNYADSSA